MSNCAVCHEPVVSGVVVHSECVGRLQKAQQLDDKPLTNGDRLRLMSDEELADSYVGELIGLAPCSLWISTHTNKLFVAKSAAIKAELDWLKQPAEVE